MRGWPLAVIATLAIGMRPTTADGIELSVKVMSDRVWTATTLEVKRGDELSITASGVMTSGKHKGITPDGLKRFTHGMVAMPTPAHPSRTAAAMALIARIGDGPVFTIGLSSKLVAASDGVLHLGINDVQLADNAGFWTVSIKRQPGNPDGSPNGGATYGARVEAAPTGGAAYGVRAVETSSIGGTSYGGADATPTPLDNTRWTSCGVTAKPATVTFFRGGTLMMSEHACGNARWSLSAPKVSFDCNAFTRYDLTLTGTELRGEWQRVGQPKQRGPACFKRAGKVVVTKPSAQQLRAYTKLVIDGATNQCRPSETWTGTLRIQFFPDGEAAAIATTPSPLAECVTRTARNTRGPKFTGPPISTELELVLSTQAATHRPAPTPTPTQTRPKPDVKATADRKPVAGCPAGTHQWGATCYRCPAGSAWVGAGKCRDAACPVGTHHWSGSCFSCPAGTTWAGRGMCRR